MKKISVTLWLWQILSSKGVSSIVSVFFPIPSTDDFGPIKFWFRPKDRRRIVLTEV